MSRMKRRIPFIVAILLFVALPASADMVWPALFLGDRLIAWTTIIFGLVVEYIFLRRFFAFGVRKAIIADIAMNAASTVLGIVLIPLAGIAWEVFPGMILYPIFKVGTFNPGTWLATFVLAVLINAALESLVIRYGFKTKVWKRGFWILFAANAISVGAAFISLFINMPEA